MDGMRFTGKKIAAISFKKPTFFKVSPLPSLVNPVVLTLLGGDPTLPASYCSDHRALVFLGLVALAYPLNIRIESQVFHL